MDMKYNEAYKGVDADKAWETVFGRLHNDGLVPEQKEAGKISMLPHRLAYAAGLLVLIAIGSIGYFFTYDMFLPKILSLHTGADNSTYIHTLDDGSVVYLADNSVLDYPATFGRGKRKVSLSGEAFFDISPKTKQPFVIETNQAVIEVLGTAFNLRSDGDNFELIVEEGQVSVTLRDLPGYSELVGEWEMVTGTVGRMEKSPVVDRTYLSWRTNRMQFRDERLEDIASVVSKNYNVNIYFAEDAIKDRRLNVTFHDNNIITIAEVIAYSMGLEYEMISDSEIRFSELK